MMTVSKNFAGTGGVVRYEGSAIDKTAALCGVVWLVSIMDTCYTWFFEWNTRYIIGSFFVFFATLQLSSHAKGLSFSKKRRMLLFFVIAFFFFIIFIKGQYIIAPFKYLPFVCLIFWRESALMKMYEYFRNYIIFYAVLSIIVELLVLSGVWRFLPHIMLPPQDLVQEQLGYTNYFYGFFSIASDSSFFAFYRASGPLREGGHFALFLGFFYLADIAIRQKRNIWIIVSGVFTLSPNFLFAFIIAELYNQIHTRSLSSVLYTIGILVIVFVLYSLFQKNIQEEIYRIIFERNLFDIYEDVGEMGIMAIIDGRATEDGLNVFSHFQRMDFMTQMSGMKIKEGFILSDYRFIIMLYGYIGMILIVSCILASSIGLAGNLFGFCMLLLAAIVFFHRAWMFDQMYFYSIMLLMENAYSQNQKYLKHARISKE